MADAVTGATGLIVDLLSSPIFPVLILLIVFGAIAAYLGILILARQGW